jgi:hypothetical protein
VKTNLVERTEDGKIRIVPMTVILVHSKLDVTPDPYYLSWNGWKTNLVKGETQKLCVTIKFPETDEWEIRIQGKGQLSDGKYVTANDYIPLTIKQDQAYYGWKEK